MEVKGLSGYDNIDASAKKTVTKYSSDTETNMSEVFKNEVLNWTEKVKEKINDDLENDRENNIKMSEKQWRELMNKVDSAISIHKQDVNTDTTVVCSKPKDEEKPL